MNDRLSDALTPYPGTSLSPEERARVDALDVPIDELTVDHVLYSLGRFVETNFVNAMQVAAEVAGDEAAREIARKAGRRHGGTGYAKLLEAAGTPGHGSAALMARYQDLAHALRGPKHAGSLYAEVEGTRCVVRKAECGFFDAARPEVAAFVGEFETGCFEAYRAVDASLETVDVRSCRWRGDGRCHIEFGWADDGDEPIPETTAQPD